MDDNYSGTPAPHPTFYFSDGTICLLDATRTYYFNVHKGLVCRHSRPLRKLTEALVNNANPSFIEGNLVLEMDDEHEDLGVFLTALYDGVYARVLIFHNKPPLTWLGSSELKYDATDFHIVSSILRLSSKYQVNHIRRDVLRGLAVAWPKTLAAWEVREADATDNQGHYRPRAIYPHPV